VKYFSSILWGVLGLMMMACADDLTEADTGKDYFPLRTGLYQIYNVEATVYELGSPTTSFYQLKTVVVDSFLTGGKYRYVIHRSKREGDESEWQYIDTWSVQQDDRETIVNEENVPFVRLKFPLRVGLEWNGNEYNTLGTDDYQLQTFRESQSFNDEVFMDCISINQNDNQDFIVYLDQRREVYARHVGLVYKETTQLQYCTQVGCLGEQIVENGLIFKQTISAYGVE